MDREEKKYEVLPGIKTPDIKSILEAASDFSNPGVENVAIKGGDIRKSLAPSQTAVAAPTKEEIENLKALGVEVGDLLSVVFVVGVKLQQIAAVNAFG